MITLESVLVFRRYLLKYLGIKDDKVFDSISNDSEKENNIVYGIEREIMQMWQNVNNW